MNAARGGGMLFSRAKFIEVTLGKADCCRSYVGDRRCFSGRVGRTDGMTETFPGMDSVFFTSYKLPKTLPATMLLLFGPVMLLCFGIFI